MIQRPIIIITIILLMISSVSAATNIAFDPLPITPAVPATFNYTVFTTGLTNTSFVLSNVTFARTDLVISNCFKNNTNINGVSFSIINLTSSLSSLQVNATNTSELFTSGITKESLFDIQFYYYNASYGNNDSVIFDASTTQWYGNATTDDAGFNAFTTMDDGWINATIANSYNNQEIVMAPQFALTVHITDSTNGLPLPVVATVTDTTNTISNTTTSGTTTLFESYGIVTGTIVAEGYIPRAFSVVVDSNMEVTYQLTPTTTISPNINTVYTQHFVSFRIVDMYQKPIQLADINASYIASSLPTGGESSSFLQQAFGVSEAVALDMQNGSIAMSGQTTTDGTQTFVMFPALTYKLMVQNDTQGVACQKTISPSDTAYAIYCPTNSQKNPNTTIAQTLNQSYVWVTEPNSSYVTFNSQYQDALAKTTNVRFIVRFASNNSILYQYDFGNPGSAKVLANYTMLNIRGLQMRAALNYTRSV